MEAALVLPFTVVVLALFLGVLQTYHTTLVLRCALMETAETMADYSCLYELLEDELAELVGENDRDASELDEWLAEKAKELLLNQAGTMLAEELLQGYLPGKTELGGVAGGQRGLSFSGSRFFYEEDSHKALICLKLRFQPELLAGGTPFDPSPLSLSCVTHAFLGDNPFRKEEEPPEDKIFRIGQGTRYHTHECYLINKNIRELSLWEAQQQGLEPCSHCLPWESAVVYASAGGECYHAEGCAHLYPNVAALDFDEARKLGLEPCKICLGDEEWFVGNE